MERNPFGLNLEDSPHRCPYDGKKMIQEVGTKAEGEERTLHYCLNCNYKFVE